MDERPPLWPGVVAHPRGGPPVYVRHAAPDEDGLPSAVLVHGLGGSSINWTGLMAELRDVYDQWAPDLPGFGESPPVRRHTVAGYVAVMTTYLETLGRPVHLIANSMGGLISVILAGRRPDLVRSLVLVSPAMPDLRLPKVARAMAILAVPRLGERLLERVSRVPAEEQVRRLAGLMYAEPGAIAPEELALAVAERERRLGQDHADTVLLESLRSIVRQYTAPPWRSAWATARLVSCPTLVLLGGRDVLVGSASAARWRRAVRQARIVKLPTTGHVAMMERPALVASLIREHLADRPGS